MAVQSEVTKPIAFGDVPNPGEWAIGGKRGQEKGSVREFRNIFVPFFSKIAVNGTVVLFFEESSLFYFSVS